MRKVSTALSLILVLTLLMSQVIYGEEATETTEPVVVAVQEVIDAPSPWAAWEVQMASVYGLGNTWTYKGYASDAYGLQLLAIESTFESAFQVQDKDKIDVDDEVTRGVAVKELFDVVTQALKLDVTSDIETASQYFVEQKLLRGKGDGTLGLDDLCTTQELIVLAKRVYDHCIYARGEETQGCYWQVSDEDNTVYLLGSIHVTDGSAYPLSKNIMNGFVDADYLAVEVNLLDNNPENMAYLQQVMMIEGETTIDQLISEEIYTKYVEVVSAAGLPAEVYNKLKPWYAAMLVQSLQMADTELDASLGIDLYFLSAAYGWKPIIELESFKQQIDIFDSFSVELQEGYLAGSFATEEDSTTSLSQLLDYWKSGNIDEISKLVAIDSSADDASKEFNEKLFTVRNAAMLEQVKNMLVKDSENDYFVVVGAGHMLNETGIVQGLIDLGYDVELIVK